VEAIQTPQNRAQFTSGPASSLRRPRRRRKGRVNRVDIDGQIDGIFADGLPNFLDDAIRAKGVDFASFDPLETGGIVVLVVGRPR